MPRSLLVALIAVPLSLSACAKPQPNDQSSPDRPAVQIDQGGGVSSAPPRDGGAKEQPPAPAPPSAPARAKPHYYNRVVAVGIGIERYRHVKSLAQFAERDTEQVLKLFADRYGFETVALIGAQATRSAITQTLDKLKGELGDNDALVVFFAGHGQVIDLPSYGSAGYLVPHDADLELEDASRPEKWAERALDMRDLTARFQDANVQHVLFVVDACCSGFMTRRGDFAARTDLSELMGRRSRTVLAASTDRRPALPDNRTGHGYFTGPVLEALRSDSAQSVTELFLTARGKTVINSQRSMLPQRGEFGAEYGEFVFIPTSIPPGQAAAAVRAARQIEVERSTARRTLPDHLLAVYDASSYRFSSKRAELEKTWKQRLERFRENASLGDPVAMAGVSLCLARGLGIDEVTERTNGEAYRFAVKAFESGHPVGKYALGICLKNGTGVEQNPSAARELLGRAVEDGFAPARLPLADSLLTRDPTQEAIRRATGLLEQADRDGLAGAVTRLAALAIKQNGAPSPAESARWLERLRPATDAGIPQAQFLTYDLLASNKELGKEDRERARACLTKAAEAEHTEAQYHLAAELLQQEWYVGRLGLPQDFSAARTWALAASDAGHYEATKMLAVIHILGLGVEASYDTANKYYQKSRRIGPFEGKWVTWFLARVNRPNQGK